MSSFAENYRAALITGASSGIGAELTRVFAAHGHDLVLVARNQARLNELADELRDRCAVKIVTLALDLSKPDAARKIHAALQSSDATIDILVNNAGIGKAGLFHEIPYADDNEMIQVNIWSLTRLTKLFAQEMVRRGKGLILNVASTGAFQPGPFIAVYYASKAYVLSFTEALDAELKTKGVRALALCPGATKTNFSRRSGKADLDSAMEAADVARAAYQGLMRRQRVIVPGLANKAAVLASKLLPRMLSAQIVGKVQRHAIDRLHQDGNQES